MSKITGQTFTCSHYLMPVGEFHWDKDHFNRGTNLTARYIPIVL